MNIGHTIACGIYIAFEVIPQQFIVTVLNVCVFDCLYWFWYCCCVNERERVNVLIEINDYHGIFRVASSRSDPFSIRQLCDFSCSIDWLNRDLLHNFSTFAAHFFPFHRSGRNVEAIKKLFIKYAGCLYSIKDRSTCQKSMAKHKPFAVQYRAHITDCICHVKSTCTY